MQKYSSIGLIPGPEESEEAFVKRAEYCLQLLKNPPEEITPCQELDPADLQRIHSIYGISPSWVPIFYSKKKLFPWHGGSLWIFQEKEETPWGAALQLRKPQPMLYSREEIITHELSHAGRMLYNEPKYEEFLAYQTSHSRFRRVFGPIIESSNEALVFVSLLAFTAIIEGISLVSYWQMLSLIKLIPVFFILAGILRLCQRHYHFRRCCAALGAIVPAEKVLPFVYRLTDDEIESFGKLKVQELRHTIDTQDSARWKSIREWIISGEISTQ